MELSMSPRNVEEAANCDLTARYVLANSVPLQAGEHRDRVLALAHRLEAELLVVAGLLLRGTQADRLEPVLARVLEQRVEQLLPGSLTAPARHDGERQLGRLLVDEPEARLALREQPVPRRAVGMRAVHRHEAGVAVASPVLDVAVDG